MADQAGYGQSLFDDEGPKAMASGIESVTSNLGQLTGGFTSLGNTTDTVLSKVEQHLDTIKQKISGLFSSMGSATSAASSAQSGQGQPATPTSASVPLNPQWSGRPALPNSGTGSAPPLAGMPQGTASTQQQFPGMQPTPPAPVQSFTPMAAPGGPSGGQPTPPMATVPFAGQPSSTPSTGPTQPGGGFPTMGTGALAGESIPAAAGGLVNSLFSGMGITQAMQGAAYGTLANAMGFGSVRSFEQNPLQGFQGGNGIYTQNATDAYNAGGMAMNQLGLTPGTGNWARTFSGAGAVQALVPGLNGSQSLQVAGGFQTPSAINISQMYGIPFRSGGVQQSPVQSAQGILSKIFPGGVPTNAQTTRDTFAPSGPGAAWLAQFGAQPGDPTYQYVESLAGVESKYAAQGKQMPDLNTEAGRKEAGLEGDYQAYQKAQTQAGKTFQQVVPDFADASACLNTAATKLLQLVDPLLKIFGGLTGGAGGSSGFFGSILKDVLPGGGASSLLGLLGIGKGKGGGGGGGGKASIGGTSTGGGGGGGGTSSSSSTPAFNAAAANATPTAPTAATTSYNYSNTGGQGPVDLTGYFTKTSSSSSGGAGGGSGGTGAGTTKLTGSGYAQQAYNFLMGKGLADYMAAGIVGNMAQESNVNPESVGSGGGGLVGWTPLPPGLVTGNPSADMVTQLNLLWSQLTGSEAGALSALKATQNAADAATVFMNKFERPAVATENQAHRVQAAENSLASKGASYARGSMNIDRTQLALLHAGERVIPAAENFSAGGRYQRLTSDGNAGGGNTIHLNFKQGSIVLQVPAGASAADMTNVANQFVSALNDPAVLAGARSS